MFQPISDDMSGNQLADWMEFKVITSPYFEASFENIWSAESLASDELIAENEEDQKKDELIMKASIEIERRSTALSMAYPFSLSADGKTLCLSSELNEGSLIYLLCLKLSIPASGAICEPKIAAILPKERELFQFCSVMAAAGYLGGSAYPFGWPRPQGNSLLQALRDAEEAMGFEGRVRDTPPVSAPTSAKDDELDVFAWLPLNDGPHWALTMWGQVASGLNWINKPLSDNKIEQFFSRWYQERPAQKPVRAMFIPFCAADGTNSGIYQQKLKDHTILFGIIFHRHRLPYYAQLFYDKSLKMYGMAHEDGSEIRQQLERWWTVFKAGIRQAAGLAA